MAIGTGLAILWVAGLSSPYAPGWMTWLDGLGALGAFYVSGRASDQDLRTQRMNGPVSLSVGLFALLDCWLGDRHGSMALLVDLRIRLRVFGFWSQRGGCRSSSERTQDA